MNRLILIGNGFDLAHGMKTRYYDFLLHYLKRAFKTSYERTYHDKLIVVERHRHIQFIDDFDLITNLGVYLDFLVDPNDRTNPTYGTLVPQKVKAFTFTVQTDFIRNLIKHCNEFNWVDLEHYYYQEIFKLFKVFKENKNTLQTWLDSQIKGLNDTFESLKTEFHDYIKLQKVSSNIDFITGPFYSELRRGINYKDNLNLTHKETEAIEKAIFEGSLKATDHNTVMPGATMFLNFNYTNTINHYLNNSFISTDVGITYVNYIHGEASGEIVFGFGDELDDEYNTLEKQNNNEYLRHIKSFYYFRDTRYKELIRFIEGNIYEVYIWGHSCGLSDRTLLNMIFENQKCRGVKIYYHKKQDGSNNYTELTQEISRHFKNKLLMRRLIIPFTECSNLPQVNPTNTL